MRLSHTDPDVVVMDIVLAGVNGLEMVTQIKRRQPQVKIVMLTAFNTEDYVREALRVGADGYVLKDAIDRRVVHGPALRFAGQEVPQPRCVRARRAKLPPPATQRREDVDGWRCSPRANAAFFS